MSTLTVVTCGAPVADSNGGPIPCVNFLPCADHPNQMERSNMKESIYQLRLIRRIEKEFPGCVVIKNDPQYIQGIPDLLILFEDRWAMLEVKTSEDAPSEPNQDYYVALWNEMSYSSFIYPENEERVFNELQLAFRTRRQARIS